MFHLQDLRLGNVEIERLRGADLKDLLHKKKLILILDLDHTLLNSTRFADITSDEEYLLRQIDGMKGIISLAKPLSHQACYIIYQFEKLEGQQKG